MKQIILTLAALIILTGCGVKSDLARPGDSFPRNYPVY
ncbi:MAG: lipoprotein [Alphaproteobacteria bacterium]|nr:lipoprotein [Alphaproteobacteria bacterium]